MIGSNADSMINRIMVKYCYLSRISIIKKIFLIIPFLVGVGFIHVWVTALLAISTSFFLLLRFKLRNINFKEILMVSLWVSFFFLYFYNYVPPEIDNIFVPISGKWYLINVVPVLLVSTLLVLSHDTWAKIEIILAISAGMFVFAIANSLCTLVILKPPYYGRAFHSVHHYVYNSPGTTILGSILPLVMIAFYGFKLSQRKNYNLILFIVISISILISLMFLARTTILMIFFSIGLKFGTSVIGRTNKVIPRKDIIRIVLLIIFVVIVLSLFTNYPSKLIERFVNGHYLIKLQHQIDYWNQVTYDFWSYPKARITMAEVYFHNFFYDSHRTSGPFTAIISYIIYGFTIFNTFKLISIKSKLGIDFLNLLLLFSAFLFTTIPWESSESQMIALYACITLLSCKKSFKA